MKPLIILLSTLAFSSMANAANDDFILQARTDSNSLSWLIDKTRLILNNTEIGDGFSGLTSLSTDPTFSMDDLSEDPVFVEVQKLISSIFHIDARNAYLRIRIPGISYNIKTLHAKPHQLQIKDPTLFLQATAQIQGVDIGLPEGIKIDLVIPDKESGKQNSFLTANIAPVNISIPDSVEPAEFDVNLEAIRDSQFSFNLKDAKLDSLPLYVQRHVKEIITTNLANGSPLTVDQIQVNPVIVRLSSLTRSIEFDAFKPLVQRKLQNIISQVMIGIGHSLKSTIGPRILKKVFANTVPSELSFSTTSIHSSFQTEYFSQPMNDQLLLGVSGQFCTFADYSQYQDDCWKHSPPRKPVRTISVADAASGKQEVSDKLASGGADVAASVSEDYLNHLLSTTIDAKLWDSVMSGEHLKLGPKGAFIVLNHANQAPELYLDLIYEGAKGITSILINPNHPIRFPLKLSTKMAFVQDRGTPKIVITTEKVLSNSIEIIEGIPEFELPSHLVPGFKKKVAALILRMASVMEGKNVIEMDLPMFKGLGLEKTWYEASAFGRLNLYFKI